MTDTTSTPATADAPLSFDKADYVGAPAPAQCVVCSSAITDAYFEINGKTVCPACRDQVDAAMSGGSSTRRFVRALTWGGLAAFAGAAVWMLITKVTGYEIGLVAIGVGFLVGIGVRKGCDARGGWLYQSLAVALTYTAIVVTYVPDIVDQMAQASEEARSEELADSRAPGTDDGSSTTDSHGANDPDADALAMDADAPPVPAFIAVPLFFGVALAIAFAAPFLMGFENVIGILIIGFALFEAWKLNKRSEVAISGPFHTTRVPAAPSIAGRSTDS